MKIACLKILFLLFVCSFFPAKAFGSAATDGPVLSKDDFKQLKGGKIILKKTDPHFLKQYSNTPWTAIAYFNQTPVELAGVVLDFHSYTKIFPKVKDLDIIPLGDSRYRLKYTVKSGLLTFRYTVIMTYTPQENLVWWDIDPENPGDFSTYKGYWKFIPKDGMTMAVYSISPIAKLPVPAFVQENGSRDEMKFTVEEIKDWIRRRGKERKVEWDNDKEGARVK